MLTLCICRTSAQGRGCETMIQGIVCVMGPLNVTAKQSAACMKWLPAGSTHRIESL